MSAAKLSVGLAVVLVLLPALTWAATPDSRRLDGRLPDNAPLVSIDQPRGTVLDALSALARQAGWTLVVTAPESATARALALQVSKKPVAEMLELVPEAGALRAPFADGVLACARTPPRPSRAGRGASDGASGTDEAASASCSAIP